MILKSTKNIEHFKPILNGLYEDFGDNFTNTILIWCGYLKDDSDYKDCLWEIWIVYNKNKVVGVCGLYSLDKKADELWLGWFGILPEHRGFGFGRDVIQELISTSKKFGANNLMSYIDKSEKVLPFYKKLGFKRKCKVRTFVKDKDIDFKNAFEDLDDVVISYKLK